MEVAPARILCKQAGIGNFTPSDTAVDEGCTICANMKQLIRYLISSSVGGSVCIILAAVLGLPETLKPSDLDILDKLPREADETMINPFLTLRYAIISVYNCATTVGAFGYWFLFNPSESQTTHYQLISLMNCYFSLEDERRQDTADLKTD